MTRLKIWCRNYCKMREIFELGRKQCLSHKEIAQELHISEKTVKKQINNALKILRLRLNIIIGLISVGINFMKQQIGTPSNSTRNIYFSITYYLSPNLKPTVMLGPYKGSRLGSVNTLTGQVSWSTGYIVVENRIFYPARNYLLPIPQSERDVSPNMTKPLVINTL